MGNMEEHYQSIAEIAYEKLQQRNSLHRREFVEIVVNYEREYKLENFLKTNENGSDQIESKILSRFRKLYTGKYRYMSRKQIWVSV